MKNNEQFRFVSLLALELENGDISLPSLPDVVSKIRKLLESDSCDFERISQAVSIDPVLVSRLLIFANSTYYNRANVEVDTLDGAIGKLGFEVVRSTAMSLAMKQLHDSNKHTKAAKSLRTIWARGMKLSSMAFAVAKLQSGMNDEAAYLCGLLHEVGKLYILTKAEEFPEFLGDADSLAAVLEEWYPQISKSILESWGFPAEVAESSDTESYVDHDIDTPANFVDILLVAKFLVDDNQENWQTFLSEDMSCQKLGLTESAAANVMLVYKDKLKTMQQSLG